MPTPKSSPAESSPASSTHLSAEECAELERWQPTFFTLPIHAQLEHQIHLCAQGIESAIVVGPPGVGKTYSIHSLLQRAEDREVERTLLDPRHEPRRILYHVAGLSTGRKTAGLDLYQRVAGPIGSGKRRSVSPHDLALLTAEELKRQHVHVVCIDEAQLISAENLDHLRQVPDFARELGHPMGLLLVGTEELRPRVVEIRQLGQRFAAEIVMVPVSSADLARHLSAFHPHLGSLKTALPKRSWDALEEQLLRKVGGKLRRLQNILANANALALKLNRRVDAVLLSAAIDRLSDEQ